MEIILLNLNSYWLELIGSISLIVSIIIYEIIAMSISLLIESLMMGEINIDIIKGVLKYIFVDIGLKWYVFIEISQHLSVGFFCLITCSDVFHEIHNIKKFYIITCIKFSNYNAISVIILEVIIKDTIRDFLINKVSEQIEKHNVTIKDNILKKIIEIIDLLIKNYFFYF